MHDDATHHECPACSLYRRTSDRIRARVAELKAEAAKEDRLGRACEQRAERRAVGTRAWQTECHDSMNHTRNAIALRANALGMLTALRLLQQEHQAEAHP